MVNMQSVRFLFISLLAGLPMGHCISCTFTWRVSGPLLSWGRSSWSWPARSLAIISPLQGCRGSIRSVGRRVPSLPAPHLSLFFFLSIISVPILIFYLAKAASPCWSPKNSSDIYDNYIQHVVHKKMMDTFGCSVAFDPLVRVAKLKLN